MKYSDSSIESEDRFENVITKSKALVALGRTGEAGKAKEKALAMGSQQQLYDYARGLQRQGHYDEAIAIFRVDVPKDPKSWIGHTAQARMDVAKGDFNAAIAEVKLAIPVAPESLKTQLSDIIVQLQNKVDINK